MKNEQDHTNADFIAKVKKHYENSQVLIISSNKSLRTNIKKVLSDLGIIFSNIGTVDDYLTAFRIIEEHTPTIIICSHQSDKMHFEELLKLHKKFLPNRYKNHFFLITEEAGEYLKNYKYDYDFDDIFCGTPNLANLIEFFTRNFEESVKLSKEKLLIAKIDELINNNEIEKVKALLNTQKLEVNFKSKLERLIKISLLEYNYNEALLYLENYMSLDTQNYFVLNSMIRANFELKKFDVAHEYIRHFSGFHSCSPKNIPIFLKIFLFNKDYLSVIRFCSKYVNIQNLDSSIKLNMAAALALAGKNIIKEKPTLAKESLELALSISGGSSFNILSMIVISILETTRDHEYATQILNQYRTNFSENQQFSSLSFEVARHTLPPGEILKETTKLINSGIKSKSIYESLISASILIGRKRESIEDLIFEACNSFPENCDYFKSLLT